MLKLSDKAPQGLRDMYADEEGEIIAQEVRDGVAFVSVLFEDVELSGVPADWFEVLT